MSSTFHHQVNQSIAGGNMAVNDNTRMHKSNLELCQTLLNQTNSIDHTAELMGEGKSSNTKEW